MSDGALAVQAPAHLNPPQAPKLPESALAVPSHRISVFVSHSWRHPRHYETLARWLLDNDWSVGRNKLSFDDRSVPRERAIRGIRSTRALRSRLTAQISCVDVVVIPSGLYASYSDWIPEEIEGAQRTGRPILAVDPRGAIRTSSVVNRAADLTVGWTAKSVIGGIWDLYRS